MGDVSEDDPAEKAWKVVEELMHPDNKEGFIKLFNENRSKSGPSTSSQVSQKNAPGTSSMKKQNSSNSFRSNTDSPRSTATIPSTVRPTEKKDSVKSLSPAPMKTPTRHVRTEPRRNNFGSISNLLRTKEVDSLMSQFNIDTPKRSRSSSTAPSQDLQSPIPKRRCVQPDVRDATPSLEESSSSRKSHTVSRSNQISEPRKQRKESNLRKESTESPRRDDSSFIVRKQKSAQSHIETNHPRWDVPYDIDSRVYGFSGEDKDDTNIDVPPMRVINGNEKYVRESPREYMTVQDVANSLTHVLEFSDESSSIVVHDEQNQTSRDWRTRETILLAVRTREQLEESSRIMKPKIDKHKKHQEEERERGTEESRKEKIKEGLKLKELEPPGYEWRAPEKYDTVESDEVLWEELFREERLKKRKRSKKRSASTHNRSSRNLSGRIQPLRHHSLFELFIDSLDGNDNNNLIDMLNLSARAALTITANNQSAYNNEKPRRNTFGRHLFREPREDSPDLQEDRIFENKIDCKIYYDIPLNKHEQEIHDEWRKTITTGEFKFPYPPTSYFNSCSHKNVKFFNAIHGDNLEPKIFPYKIHPAMKVYQFDLDMNEFRRQMIEDLSKPSTVANARNTWTVQPGPPKIMLTEEEQTAYEELPDFDPFSFYKFRKTDDTERHRLKSRNSKYREESSSEAKKRPARRESLESTTMSPVRKMFSYSVVTSVESGSPAISKRSSAVSTPPVAPEQTQLLEQSPEMEISEPFDTSLPSSTSLRNSPISHKAEITEPPVAPMSEHPMVERSESQEEISPIPTRGSSILNSREASVLSQKSQPHEEYPEDQLLEPLQELPPSTVQHWEPSMAQDGEPKATEKKTDSPVVQRSDSPVVTEESPPVAVPKKQLRRRTSERNADSLRKQIVQRMEMRNSESLKLQEKRKKLLGVERANEVLNRETPVVKASYEKLLEGCSSAQRNEDNEQLLSGAPTEEPLELESVQQVDNLMNGESSIEAAAHDSVSAPTPVEPEDIVQAPQVLEKSSEPEHLLLENLAELEETTSRADISISEERILLGEPEEEAPQHVSNIHQRSLTPDILKETLDDEPLDDLVFDPNLQLDDNSKTPPLINNAIEDLLLEDAAQDAHPFGFDDLDYNEMYGVLDDVSMPTAEQERQLLDEPDVPEVPQVEPEVVQKVEKKVQKSRRGKKKVETKNVSEPAPVSKEVPEEEPTMRTTRSRAARGAAEAKPSAKPVAKRGRAARKTTREPDIEQREEVEEQEEEIPETRKRRRNEDSPPPEPSQSIRAKRLYISRNNPNPRTRAQTGSDIPSTSTATAVRQTGVFEQDIPAPTVHLPTQLVKLIEGNGEPDMETGPENEPEIEPSSEQNKGHTPISEDEIKKEQDSEHWEIPPPITETSRQSKKRKRTQQTTVLEEIKQEVEVPDDEFQIVQSCAVPSKKVKTEEAVDDDVYVELATFNLSSGVTPLEVNTVAKVIREDGAQNPDHVYLITKRLWDESNQVFLTDPYKFSQFMLLLFEDDKNRGRYSVTVENRDSDFDPKFIEFLAKGPKILEKDIEKCIAFKAFSDAFREKGCQRLINNSVTSISLHKLIDKISATKTMIINETPAGLIGEAEKDNLNAVEKVLWGQFITSTMKLASLSLLTWASVEHLNRRLTMLQDGWIMFLRMGGFFRVLLAFDRDDVMKMSDEFRAYCVEYLKEMEENHQLAVRTFLMDDGAVMNQIFERTGLTSDDIKELDDDIRVEKSETHCHECSTCLLNIGKNVYFSSFDKLEKHERIHNEEEGECPKCYAEYPISSEPFHRILFHDNARCRYDD